MIPSLQTLLSLQHHVVKILKKTYLIFSAILFCAVLSGCMEWDYAMPEDFDSSGPGVFIINEGNFQYGNASLSFYNPADGMVSNEVFLRANSMKLGDVAQSMTICGDQGWIAVNNSHVIFAIDVNTFREKGRIENAGQPRYIHFVDNKKAYVSQIWDNKILIIDAERYEVSGEISIPGMEASGGSTEQMVQIGHYLYCVCWSYQNMIVKIDTRSDTVVATLRVGRQPNSIVADANDHLWVLCDGGASETNAIPEVSSLQCIDAEKMKVIKRFEFDSQSYPSELCIDPSGSMLYWINSDIEKMPIDALTFAPECVVASRATIYYGLGIDPDNGEIYVADAIDYQQPGIIFRYSPEGSLLDKFYVGVTPGAFCFKK